MEKRHGVVLATIEREIDQLVTVRYDNGAVVEISVPVGLHVEPGGPVTSLDTGDGKPIYSWV